MMKKIKVLNLKLTAELSEKIQWLCEYKGLTQATQLVGLLITEEYRRGQGQLMMNTPQEEDS
jgi:hypothetical protein